jgi:hypothetical protein
MNGNGSGLGAIGSELGEAIVAPAVRKALMDPHTLKLAEVQLATLIESETVQKALAPTLKKVLVYGFVAVLLGGVVANLITRRI